MGLDPKGKESSITSTSLCSGMGRSVCPSVCFTCHNARLFLTLLGISSAGGRILQALRLSFFRKQVLGPDGDCG